MQSSRRRSMSFLALTLVVLTWSPRMGASQGHNPAMADFETLIFCGAAACSACHAAADSQRGADPDDGPVIVGLWSAGIMAYGSDDPFFQAKVRSEVLRAPEHRGLIEAKCSACHNLKTPYPVVQGQIVGEDPPEQMILSEWHSGDSASFEDPTGCRQCHLPTEDDGHTAGRPPWLDERAHAWHAFVCANTESLSLLAMETALQGGDPAPLLASVDAGRELLTHAGELELLAATLHDGTLEFAIRIGNLTGHKLPTAFPSRRVYLHAVVKDDRGEIVFESGAMMHDGRITGVDSDEDPGAFEPHHRTISRPDQVQVYEAVMGNTDDNVTVTLLRASQYLKDNRIVPPGFDPATAAEDIRPAGYSLNDPDFGFGHDEITYQLGGLAESRYQVSVELRHQAISYPYLRDLAELSDDPVISRFLNLYDAVRPGSELIAALVFEVGG